MNMENLRMLSHGSRKGASLGQAESTAELADYYYHFYDTKELRRLIPYNPVKAIGLYRRAATKHFSDAGYAALQAAFGYIFHIGHLPLDWGLIADLTHMAATKERFMFYLTIYWLYANPWLRGNEKYTFRCTILNTCTR